MEGSLVSKMFHKAFFGLPHLYPIIRWSAAAKGVQHDTHMLMDNVNHIKIQWQSLMVSSTCLITCICIHVWCGLRNWYDGWLPQSMVYSKFATSHVSWGALNGSIENRDMELFCRLVRRLASDCLVVTKRFAFIT